MPKQPKSKKETLDICELKAKEVLQVTDIYKALKQISWNYLNQGERQYPPLKNSIRTKMF